MAKETLRVRPILSGIGRMLTRPATVAGYHLEAGTMVVPAIGLVHASDAIYSDPERFDPDRMLGANLSPTTWLPFGGGNRRCLGSTFAMVEMRVVLREVLRRTELSSTTAKDEAQNSKHVIHVPGRGALIQVRAVRQVPSALPASCPVAHDTQLPRQPSPEIH